MNEQQIYFPGDTYTTAPDAGTAFGKMFPGLSFYARLIKTVVDDGRQAGRGVYSGQDWAYGSLKTLRALEVSGVKIMAEGMDHIDAVKGPCVFIANHMSTLETFILPCFIQPRKDVTFVAKESLLQYPLFGNVFKSREPITVGRTNPRQDLVAVLEGGVERLQAGRSIIVFPQSTRSHVFDPGQFNTIGVKLAKKAGVPVIPVALQTQAWGVGTLIKEFGPINSSIPVRFCFGAPMNITGTGKEEHALICRFISDKLQAWAQPALLG